MTNRGRRAPASIESIEGVPEVFLMLWALTILLLFLWVLGVATSSQLGMWIHILLVIALVSLVVNLVRGRRVI